MSETHAARRGVPFAVVVVVSASMFPRAGHGAEHPVPEDAAQEKALATIRDIFENEYAKTATDARAAFAKTLIKTAIDTKNNLPARYVLFREAARIAAEAGQLDTALEAVRQTAAHFQADEHLLRGKTLYTAAANATKPDTLRDIVAAFLQLADDAIAQDNYDIANRAARAAQRAAVKAKDRSLTRISHELLDAA